MADLTLSDAYNRDTIEDAYTRWVKQPDSVDVTWQAFFAGAEFAGNGIGAKLATQSVSVDPAAVDALRDARLQTGVTRLVNWYRQVGHVQAHTDPLADAPPPPSPQLALSNFNLSDADLDREVDASMVFGLDGRATLRQVLDILTSTYCGRIGVEFMHIDDLDRRMWLASRMESVRGKFALDRRQKYRILMDLNYATNFENYLHTKYAGKKRFSLEGGETLIPMLDEIVTRSPGVGVKEVVIGMAHRGRLNVLTNILRKPFELIFNEFEDHYLPDSTIDGDGDVKYHMGYSTDIKTPDNHTVHVSLTANPSHLEIVNPVVEGRVRAKQRARGNHDDVMALLIHGDAAFMGQGPVAETLNLANLKGYRTGGTYHVVINNQIGFTTNPGDARSTRYCTDLAKFIQAPIFHVHGEDPEAAVYLSQLALEYRQEFKSDVVIDLVCYRKYGHNEGDEPAHTQPVQYRKIKAKKPIPEVYTRQLVADGVIAQDEADAITADFRTKLDQALQGVKSSPPQPKKMQGFTGVWEGFTKTYSHAPVDTTAPLATLDRLADQFVSVPEGFHWHPTVKKLAERRQSEIKARGQLDWGTAEMLAFGATVLENTMVRLSGQDCRRGTFAHRHSCYYDQETGASACPFTRIDPKQAPFDVYDSSLSEAAILGFEYGYTLDDPKALVMWEAQFGDFANGAQVVIDQFITSGESKWNRSSGVVMLLPHGHEGQGPEHSSARLERFLQMCAEDNIQVCNITTPANYFHALRRQVKRNVRKPLVVMTPKSLLRHPAVVSPVDHFTDFARPEGKFREVIDDAGVADPAGIKRVVLCSGKLYYDLDAKRTKDAVEGVAIVRLEQLYPFPEAQLLAVLRRYPNAAEWVWAQEESYNNGAHFFVAPILKHLGFPFEFVGRDASASPATGSEFVHKYEQADLVDAALTKPAPYYVKAMRRPSAPAPKPTATTAESAGTKGTAAG